MHCAGMRNFSIAPDGGLNDQWLCEGDALNLSLPSLWAKNSEVTFPMDNIKTHSNDTFVKHNYVIFLNIQWVYLW